MEIRPIRKKNLFELALEPVEQKTIGAAFRERIASDVTSGRLSHTDTEAMSQRLRFARLFDHYTEVENTEVVDASTMQEMAVTVRDFADGTTAVVTDMYNYGGEQHFANSAAITRLELGRCALNLAQEFEAAAPMYQSIDNL